MVDVDSDSCLPVVVQRSASDAKVASRRAARKEELQLLPRPVFLYDVPSKSIIGAMLLLSCVTLAGDSEHLDWTASRVVMLRERMCVEPGVAVYISNVFDLQKSSRPQSAWRK